MRQSRAPRASRSRVSGISSSNRWSRIPGVVKDGGCGEYPVSDLAVLSMVLYRKGRLGVWCVATGKYRIYPVFL